MSHVEKDKLHACSGGLEICVSSFINVTKPLIFMGSNICSLFPINWPKNFNWLQNRRKTWVVSSRPSLYFLETPIWQSYCFWKSWLPICFQFSPWQKFPRLQSRSTSPRSLQNYFGFWFTRIWWFWTSKSFHRIPYPWRWLCGSRKFAHMRMVYIPARAAFILARKVWLFFKYWVIELIS